MVPDNMVISILSGPLRGKKWIAGSHNTSVWLGTYESNPSRIFSEKCKDKKIFWDLGAHAGYYTLLFKTVNKNSTVYSFEPVENNFENFKKHVDLNKLNGVIPFQKAVSDKEGRLRFAKGNSVGGKLSESGDMEVSVVRLSRLVEEETIQLPDLIKMDIEDAEYKVLLDLKPFLVSEKKPVIFLSTHGKGTRDACLSLIRTLDYKIFPLDDNSMAGAREFLIEPN